MTHSTLSFGWAVESWSGRVRRCAGAFALFGLLSLRAIAAESTALRLTSPTDYQVIQRSSRKEGEVQIAGTLSAAISGEPRVEARWRNAIAFGGWQTLGTLAPGTTEFAAPIIAPAGGWHQIEVRVRVGDSVMSEATVEHVGVGEVFVVAGQSNSANHGEERQKAKSGRVATFADGKWRIADDPQPGASGDGGSFLPPLGDALAAQWSVPIGFVATGAGGTSVREWMPKGTRFARPPTVMGNVTEVPGVGWESKGILFDRLVARVKSLGPGGFRALLWHQGESDANQADATRTLPGDDYRRLLGQLIRDTWRESGWEFPWFVAQVSYHTPDDPGSPDLRAAQVAVVSEGLAVAGPDSDSLTGKWRDGGGKGVHFSGPGLRAHAALWQEKLGPWLETQLVLAKTNAPGVRLRLPGTENFTVAGRPAFLYLPAPSLRSDPQPWVFYAPTLAPYPDEAERWMHEKFLAAGIAVAGVDIGEGYGSPASLPAFEALYDELTQHRGFAKKPCLFGRSRGGLWVSRWALAHPDRVAGIIGIYPVFDFRTYPGLTNAAPAYGLSPAELDQQSDRLNPVKRLGELARAGIPVVLIHGDQDVVVPLKENSGELVRLYREVGKETEVKLLVLEGQGHNFFPGFFHSPELVAFAIEHAREGAKP